MTFAFTALTRVPSAVSDTNALLAAWLVRQAGVQSWSAEVVQTRALKSLTQPLTVRGRVWFAAPNRFRWEIGDPPQTIAVRQTHRLLIIYPGLRRVETYPLGGTSSGRWKETLALLEAGFARSQEELESRFRVVGHSSAEGIHAVVLQPSSASARRFMPRIRIAFATNDFSLRSTEIEFADGSTMRNDYSNAVLNAALDDSLFEPQVSADFEWIEPLNRNRDRREAGAP